MKDVTIKIAVAGNVDSGKSTLAGVLMSNKLDDGRGSCRELILRTPHEKSSGRTSTISNNNVIHIDEEKQTRQIISLIDLAGHEKYLKTTIYGMTGYCIDYGLILVGANMGLTRMTKEHLGILLYMKIPIIVLMTKVDICPENIFKATERKLRQILKLPLFNKRPYFFNLDEEKSLTEMDKFLSLPEPLNTFIPVIPMSNKTGVNLESVKKLLLSLQPRHTWPDKINGSIVYIDSTFNVKGIGLVISGTVRGKPINVNQKLWIGPYHGDFIPFKVRSLHNNVRENVESVSDTEVVCIAVRFTTKKTLSK